MEPIILLFHRTYLCHCEDFLGSAEEILTKGMPDLLEGDKNGFSEVYPTLTKSTFAVYYKTVFTELVTCVKGIQPGKQREDRDVSTYILMYYQHLLKSNFVDFIVKLIHEIVHQSAISNTLMYR